MTAISTAIGEERRARVFGYAIKKGFFDSETGNLPHQIIILGEANTANQATLNTLAKEITSAEQAGKIYGFGSPIYNVMRILRPKNGDGVAGIPTIVIPQLSDEDAVESTTVWTISGVATGNKTHYLKVAGRTSLDAEKYSYTVSEGDTPTMVAGKVVSSLSNILGAPVTATNLAGVITFKTKWKGATSELVKVDFFTDGDLVGLTYAQTSFTAGAGEVSLANALSQFESNWYTDVINTYGQSQLDTLETFNGFPYDENPTGRFEGRNFRPFISFFGTTIASVEDLAEITNDSSRINQCTNVICPAPNSDGMPMEAAANMVRLFARNAQDNPHLDISGYAYPDMPTPDSIGEMADYNNRDFLVKKGCSTVTLKNGYYEVEDLVTTYHPAGEDPLQYSRPRNLNIDFNIKDGYSILESQRVKDHVIIRDNQVTEVNKAIKPKEWKSLLYSYFDDLAESALINDAAFSKSSLRVQISTVVPSRLETTFRYKRTETVRIGSTTAEAGF